MKTVTLNKPYRLNVNLTGVVKKVEEINGVTYAGLVTYENGKRGHQLFVPIEVLQEAYDGE